LATSLIRRRCEAASESQFVISPAPALRFAPRMVSRPVIFISAVSKELRGARDLVAKTLLAMGYDPKWQDIAPAAAGDLRGVLRKWVDESAAVIQLVGHCYGFEPRKPDAEFGRVSYTQYEALYARQREKKVWYLFLAPGHPTEPSDPDAPAESDELRRLQEAYRQRVRSEGHLYHESASLDQTKLIVHQLRDDLAHLRRRGKQLAALVLALLVLSAGLGFWMLQKQTRTGHGIEEIKTIVADPAVLRVKLEEKIDETFERKKRDLLAAKAPSTEVDALYRWRDRAKGQVAEGVAFITARAADPKSPIIGRAAAILEERGVDAALEFLDTTLKAERQRHKEEARQLAEASMMKAGLHESRLEAEEQEHAIRDALADAPDWWRPHNDLGLIMFRRAQWQTAEQEFEAARKSMTAEAEGTVLNNLAQLYQDTNRLGEAEPLMERALKIGEQGFGPEHPNVAIRLNNLAQLYQDTNRLAEAEPLMERALKIDEKSYGPEHPNVAIRLNNLAQLYQDTNRLAEAEPLMERALKIDEKSFGREHPKVAIRLNNLAALYYRTNRLAEAEPLMERALKIDEKSFGKEHPKVAIRLNNLAQLYQDTNRLAEAEPLMERALEIDEKSFGKEHPKIAIRLNNLAQLYQDTNRLAEAEPLMDRALKIDEKSFGPEHPNVATELNNLAQLYQDTNRLAEAEPLMDRALKIDEKSFGKEHPKVAIRLNNLAQLYQATNRLAEAEPLLRRAGVILLKSTHAAGRIVPNLQDDVANYQSLLRKMSVPEAEVSERLAAMVREAGFTQAESETLLAPIFGPFEVAVTQVVPEGQGAALGIRVGDVVRRYHGQEITKTADLQKLTGEVKGDAIPLEIQRGDETLKLTAKPGRLGLALEDRPKPRAK
jgi:tetratricopeptide (TPR) repeat protein